MNYRSATFLPVLQCCVLRSELSTSLIKKSPGSFFFRIVIMCSQFFLSWLLLQLNRLSLLRKRCFLSLPGYLFILPKLEVGWSLYIIMVCYKNKVVRLTVVLF